MITPLDFVGGAQLNVTFLEVIVLIKIITGGVPGPGLKTKHYFLQLIIILCLLSSLVKVISADAGPSPTIVAALTEQV